MERASNEITQLLLAWREGDEEALQALTPLVYGELHRLAKRYMAREQSSSVLQTTALVHEAFLRLVDAGRVDCRNRTHLFALSARIMRHILVDFARSRRNLRRGGDLLRVSFDEALPAADERAPDLLALDEALDALEATDHRKSRVVELRFFGGLSIQETADALEVSPETVMRDWRLAKMWLLRELDRRSV